VRTEKIRELLYEHLDDTDESGNTVFEFFDWNFYIGVNNGLYSVEAERDNVNSTYEVSRSRYVYEHIFKDFMAFLDEVDATF
jgi:hypothetical protein